MLKMEKDIIVLYNLNEIEKNKIEKIFQDLKIDIEIQEAQIEEDIID